jgi:hypothetical protein
MNKHSLVEAIRAGRARLETVLDQFSDEQMLDRVDEVWTRKDILAHLEAWERRAVTLLVRLRAGDPPTDGVETDELNEHFYLADKDRSLADVRASERRAFDAILASVDQATDEELFDADRFAWCEGEPLAAWFRGDTDEHYDEHIEQLVRPARPPRAPAADPERVVKT